MNYNELFNVFYSNLPESAKVSILEKIPSDIITEKLNESSSEIGAYVELLDTLAYSSVSEATVESIIDEVFSGLSADVTEEILEAYVREKAIQYIEEAIAHGTDAIGLAGMGRERAEREAKAQKVQARREAINNVVDNTVTRARELKDRAVTGARQTAEKIGQKANDIRNTMANKAGEVKNKAVSGIKNAVGKVRDYVKKTMEPSAKDYVNAIGKKALENEKSELKVKPGSYADRYAKAMKQHEETYGKLNKPKVEVAKVKAEKVKKAKAEIKKEEKPKVESKVEAEKVKAETPEVKAEEVKKTKKVKDGTSKVKVKKEEKPKVEIAKAKAEKVQKPKKETEIKKEEKPKAEVKKEEKAIETSSKSPIKVKNVYKAHGDLKPSEEARIKAEAKKEKEVKKEEKLKVEPEVKAETPKAEIKKEEKPKKEDIIDKEMNSSRGVKRTKEQMDKIYAVKSRNEEQQNIKRVRDEIDMLGKEIDAAEGKPSMMSTKQEKMKKREELRKKLQELQLAQTNEAISDLVCTLIRTNISESSFVEVIKMIKPRSRKLKFQEIASKLVN